MRRQIVRPRAHTAAAVYSCWSCGADFEVTECDGLTDDLEVACPVCGSDLVAVDQVPVCKKSASRVSYMV